MVGYRFQITYQITIICTLCMKSEYQILHSSIFHQVQNNFDVEKNIFTDPIISEIHCKNCQKAQKAKKK